MHVRKHQGFTLVELLIVVGIVTLLIAILLPALNKAHEIANSLKCASNLRTLGLSFSQYADAYHGFLPAGNTCYTSPDPADWTGLVQPYLVNGKSYNVMALFMCPSNLLANAAATYPQAYSYSASTSLSGILIRTDLGPRPMKISNIDNASEKIMLFETDTPTSVLGNTPDGCGHKICYNWHQHGANYLFADNSVQYIKDPLFDTPLALRSSAAWPSDGTTATQLNWFRQTQSRTGTGYDRLWIPGVVY